MNNNGKHLNGRPVTDEEMAEYEIAKLNHDARIRAKKEFLQAVLKRAKQFGFPEAHAYFTSLIDQEWSMDAPTGPVTIAQTTTNMEPLSKLLLMSTRKRELESAIEVYKNRMNRDAWRILEATKEIQEIDREAEKLNGELKEEQSDLYKFGKQ